MGRHPPHAKRKIASAGLLLSKTGQFSRLAAKAIDRELSSIGISYQEMRVAGLLMGEPEITQKQLADKLMVKPATLSVALSKLEAANVIRRVQSSRDKRVNYLEIIPGKKITRVDDVLNSVEKTITRGISKADLATTQQVLNQLINNLQLVNEQEHQT